MQRSRWPLVFLILALACAAVAGFVRLFELRFTAGDIYPPYSSLRADPLGAEVFHDALADTGAIDVTRNYLPLEKIAAPRNSAIIYAGAPTDVWPLSDVKDLEKLATNGARVIVTFLPRDQQPARPSATPGKDKSKASDKDKKKPKKPGDETPSEEPETILCSDLAKRWNLPLAWRRAELPTLTASAMIPGLERSLSWHTALCFTNPGAMWRVIYRCDGGPVVVERNYGRGSFVVASDSFFISNEAMRTERAPRLLAWLIGAASNVVFDETHLGVQENPGIVTLARKYHLEGFVAAILVLAALLVWEAGSPFLPPHRADAAHEEIIAGKDASAGFVSLLRRGIAPARLIGVCVGQWKKTFAHQPGKMSASLARIDAIATGQDPVAVYRAIAQILAEKK